MRDYAKVYTCFWSSPTTASLSDDARLMALYLMTCPHNTIAGLFRLPDGYLCEDLGWAAGRVSKGLAELQEKGFATRCGVTKWVWIRKHLEWNPPENPNQAKAAAKVVRSVPDDCGWKAAFMRVFGELLGFEVPAEAAEVETLSEPFRNQKQEQEQEQEQELIINSSKEGAPPSRGLRVEYQKVVDLYHECLPNLPRCVTLTDGRKRAISGRWRQIAGGSATPTPADVLSAFKDYFSVVGRSDFLTGKKTSFVATLDWLMGAENFAKTIEGRYENERRAA